METACALGGTPLLQKQLLIVLTKGPLDVEADEVSGLALIHA